jgi:hypothetical protein
MHRPRIERRIRHSFSGNLCLSVGFFTRLLRPARHSVPPDVSSRLYRTEHCTAAETQFVVALYVRMCWRGCRITRIGPVRRARFTRCVVNEDRESKSLAAGTKQGQSGGLRQVAGSVLFADRLDSRTKASAGGGDRTHTPLRARDFKGTRRHENRPRSQASILQILQILQHLGDSEVVSGWRIRLILAEDRPQLTGYDQDLWAERLHDDNEDPLKRSNYSRSSGARTCASSNGHRIQTWRG